MQNARPISGNTLAALLQIYGMYRLKSSSTARETQFKRQPALGLRGSVTMSCSERPLALKASAIPERTGERPHRNHLPEGERICHTPSEATECQYAAVDQATVPAARGVVSAGRVGKLGTPSSNFLAGGHFVRSIVPGEWWFQTGPGASIWDKMKV